MIIAMNPVDLASRPRTAKANPRAFTAAQRRMYDQIPQEMSFVAHPSFSLPGAGESLFGPAAPQVHVPEWTEVPQVPEEVATRAKGKRKLTRAEEEHLFLSYNYARYRLNRLIEAQRRRFSTPRARTMLRWFARALDCRARIVRANMALVLAMAKRTRIPNVDFAEMVSEGNMALLRSVEKFDVSRGFKFSTYACRAILKGFNRLATMTGKYHRRFPAEYDPEMEPSDYDVRKHDMQLEDSVDDLREILARNQANLSDVERVIVMERFAIGAAQPKRRTLTEVGRIVGLTNERVRQLQNLALRKLRTAMDERLVKA